MFGLPSFRIGRPFGIPLEVDASWVLVFLLVASTLTLSYFPTALPGRGPVLYTALGLLTAVAFFGSLVLHELAHSLVARARGIKVARVTLFVFGGVSQLEDEPHSPGHEFAMAAAGPGTSLLIGAVCLGLRALLLGIGAADTWWLPFEYLGLINISLAAFNLLPGFPLDGGRVFRAIMWAITGDFRKATKIASRSGQVIGMMLVGVGVYGLIRGTLDLMWFAVIGWFLSNMSATAYQQTMLRAALAEVKLREIMSSPAVLAPADATLDEMAHSYFLAGRHTRYPVVDDGRAIGMIDIARANTVPRESWSSTRVRDVASRDLASIAAGPDASVDAVLPLLEPDGPGAVIVVEGGRLAGIVTRADVIRYIRGVARAT